MEHNELIMKKVTISVLLLLLASGHSLVSAQAPAFPGAEGHGRYETVGAWLGRMRCESEREAEREAERIHRKQEREAAALAEAAAAKW